MHLGELDDQELLSFVEGLEEVDIDIFAAEFSNPSSPSTDGSEQDSPDANVDEASPDSAAAVVVMDISLRTTTVVDVAAEMAAPEGAAMAVDEGHAVAAQLGIAVADNHATDDAPRAVSLREEASRQSFLGRFLRQCASDLESQGTPMSPGVAAVVENLRQTSETLNDGLMPADTIAVRVLFDAIGALMGLNSQQIADVAQNTFRHAGQNLMPHESAGSAATSFVFAHEQQVPLAAAQFAPVGLPLSPKMAGFVCAPELLWGGWFNIHNIEYQTCHKVPQPDGSYKRPKISKKIFGGGHLSRFDTSLQAGVTQVPARSVITDTRIRVVQDRVDKSIWLWIPQSSSPESSMREATGVQQISNHFGEMLRHRRSASSHGWVGYICDSYPRGSETLSVMSEF